MIYRKLDAQGDYSFGNSKGDFHENTPEAVGQAVKTRLSLSEGEWFLNTAEGTPYNSQILGAGKISYYDVAIQSVIRETVGVKKLISYASQVEPETRKATIVCTIDTIYGETTVEQTL